MQQPSSSNTAEGVVFVSIAVTLVLMILFVTVGENDQSSATKAVRLSMGEWAPYTSKSLPQKA
ncbi:MAG: hypothetical protein MK214_08270 [Thalassotalea sp.]|jgi:hypothetical protein|nr:hypothetical protein [Thalassotalea sp.]